jgi:hypothetical protein
MVAESGMHTCMIPGRDPRGGSGDFMVEAMLRVRCLTLIFGPCFPHPSLHPTLHSYGYADTSRSSSILQ